MPAGTPQSIQQSAFESEEFGPACILLEHRRDEAKSRDQVDQLLPSSGANQLRLLPDCPGPTPRQSCGLGFVSPLLC